MSGNIYIYLAVMAAATYAVRVLPLTLIRKKIKWKFVNSFLYYIPYATLSVMTFPAMIYAVQSPIAGAAALLIGVISAYLKQGLFKVAAACCLTVFVLELILV